MFTKYFKLNKKVATILTNLCCHPNGFLPQGAPTSPIISNILCKSLDRELTRLANDSFGSTYTRYADDITFSSNRPFKLNIVKEVNSEIIISNYLEKIISDNGFNINQNKVRLQKYYQHQEVTGIVVNEKLNINRKYYRRIRAMLHSIEENKDNLSIPIKRFSEIKKENKNGKDLFRSIKGMIEHVGMVKGKEDPIYIKLAKKFNELLFSQGFDGISLIPVFEKEEYEDFVCVIKSQEHPFSTHDNDYNRLAYGQGTGFLLKNYGIVSNYHVFQEIIELGFNENFEPVGDEYFIKVYFGKDTRRLVKAKIQNYDEELDLILLTPEKDDLIKTGFEISTQNLQKNDIIWLLGYPEYNEGDQLKHESGKYLREVNDEIRKLEISQTIFGGNSGGPVLNKDNQVIGVATEGKRTTTNKAVPITYIDLLVVKDSYT